jgi:proteasome lid subunit RPN8/RPN11
MTRISRTRKQRRPPHRRSARPSLRFSPTAWAKLLFLRDYGETEVGGFGIADAADPLRLDDFQLIGQTASWSQVAFDDDAVADFFDRQVDEGRQPEQFARVWIHTHPGDSPRPSSTDEETFQRVFGGADWAVMFILASGGASYARLRFNSGPGGSLEPRVEVDYSRPFSATDHEAWELEYSNHVHPQPDGRLATISGVELADWWEVGEFPEL